MRDRGPRTDGDRRPSGDRRPRSDADRRPAASGSRRPEAGGRSAGRPDRGGIPQGARATFVAEPALSDEHTVAALDTDVRRDLRGLQKDTADSVARHLVTAGSLVEEDPELALEHARFARRRASRIAVVREAAGIAAYHAGEWAEALAELRAARRMGGGPVHLPVMADIERALGRPERAVDIARGTEAAELDTAGRIELAIVGAGARRDLGELDAAVVGLQIPELDPKRREPWSARLFYAYADNLLAAGRESDALQWFVHAADADTDGETDAVGRIAALTGEDPDDADDFAFGVEDIDLATDVAGPAGDGDVPVDDLAADAATDDVTPAEGAPDGDPAAADVVGGTRTPDGDGDPADAEPADAGVAGGEADVADVDVADVAADDVAATEVAATEVAADGSTATGVAPDSVAVDEVLADEVPADGVLADEVPAYGVPADEVASDDQVAPVDGGTATEDTVGEGASVEDPGRMDAVDGDAADQDVTGGDPAGTGDPDSTSSDSGTSDPAPSPVAGAGVVDGSGEGPDGALEPAQEAGESPGSGDGAVR